MRSVTPWMRWLSSATARLLGAALIAALVDRATLLAAGAEEPAPARAETNDDAQHVRWSHFVEVVLPEKKPSSGKENSPWFDLIVPTGVFSDARPDLGDLRLYDATGKEIAYALRVRETKYSDEEVTAREFNRSTGPNDSSEVALDLGSEPPEHNELDVRLPGANFRRHGRLDASADGDDWRKLTEHDLFSFEVDDKELHDLRLTYPPSRFRYLRLRVERDPAVDEKPVEIEAARVHYRVELPGEFSMIDSTVSPREAVRTMNGPGSAWVIDLGVERFACERLEVDVSDEEFSRDYRVEAGGPVGADEPFVEVASGQWSRRAGERQRPLSADFPERHCARLRLIVTDYSNPPLEISDCRAFGAARQVVFARSESLEGPLRLYLRKPAGRAAALRHRAESESAA